ncbi:hypothetical protein ACSYDW_07140 [Paeniglutamicibacter sp. R2-26]|uniref:hypothetical protein n=1 Tax=Paeniglutamicibacter sp. R2-26 TaxID=3144417 RepID=UPI003EE7B18B
MSANNGTQGSAKVLAAQQRDIDALKARTENPDLTWQRIANQFGYASRGAACKAVLDLHRRNQQTASDEFRAKWDAEFDVALDEVKNILGGTYDAESDLEDMLFVAETDADAGRAIEAVYGRLRTDYKLRLEAVTALARINERVSKMHGYDAPAKVEASGTAGFNVVIPSALLPEGASLPDDITSS